MNLLKRDKIFVIEELENSTGAVEGLMCEPSEHHRVANYLEEQGYADIWERVAGQHNRIAVLKNVWIEEDSKGLGLGGELVEWFMMEAENRRMEAVYLVADTLTDNSFNLIQWYESRGFVNITDKTECPLMKWTSPYVTDL